MEKDKDSLCSLHLKSHIKNVERCRQEKQDLPEVYIRIQDNCVRQNKLNVTMMFDCWMAMSIYKRVMIIFLIPGQSHIIADRVVAWVKASLQNRDIFLPEVLTKEMNKVNSVKRELTSCTGRRRTCITGWEESLGNHCKKINANFISNYVFEFYKGQATMTHLITNDPEYSVNSPPVQKWKPRSHNN